jgi:hypothetical protein
MKSYGRAPTFLMLTGYEQVRSVVAELSGDVEAARRVELTLPPTGVCSTTSVGAETDAGCCGEVAATSCAPTPAAAGTEPAAACCAPATIPLRGLGRPRTPGC